MATFDGSLTWLGHSTFMLETPAGQRVLLEAWVDTSPVTPDPFKGDGLGAVDAILITHGHSDHTGDVLAIHERTGAMVGGMVELMVWLSEQGIADESLVDFNKGGTVELAGLRVTMTDAKHSASNDDGHYMGEPAGFVIELDGGFTIYFAGDTDVFGDMALIGELHDIDLAILPIGGHYTMDPRRAAKALELLGAPHALGMHYATFPPLAGRPEHVREELTRRGVSSVTMHELQVGGTLTGTDLR